MKQQPSFVELEVFECLCASATLVYAATIMMLVLAGS